MTIVCEQDEITAVFVCIAETPTSMPSAEFSVRWDHYQGRINGTEIGPSMHTPANINAELLVSPLEPIEILDSEVSKPAAEGTDEPNDGSIGEQTVGDIKAPDVAAKR
jgi:hypothetical protein